MVTPELKKLFASEGIAVIPREAGAAWCAAAAAAPCGSPVETVILGCGSTLPATDLGQTLTISCDSLPLLRDHVIDAKAVLPAAWAAELLIAAGGCGSAAGLRLADFTVLKGLRLGGDEIVRLDCQRDDTGVLLSADGRPAYRARCERLGQWPLQPSLEAQDLLPITAGWYGDDRLFHGPALHLLNAAAVNERSLVADAALRGLGRPAALDALFQALILWSWKRHGAPCLPLGWEALDCCADDLPAQVQIRAQIVAEQGLNLVANAEICVGELLLLRLSGVRATVSERLVEAFALNQLG
jgi:hypothetical protein